MNQVTNLLLEKRKQDGINLGELLSRIVLDANPKSPQEDIEAVIKGLNLFYDGQFIFKQHPWKSRQLGKHKQTIASIEVEPFK